MALKDLVDNSVFLFLWAAVAGIVSFGANLLAERLKSRREARLSVASETQIQTLEHLIVSVEQMVAAKSKELKALRTYGLKLKDLGLEAPVTPEIQSLEQLTLDAVYHPVPPNLFVPPEFAALLDAIDLEAKVAWLTIGSAQDLPSHRGQIDGALVDVDRCLKSLGSAARNTRGALWQELRSTWRDAGAPSILAKVSLEEAHALLKGES